MRLRFAPFIALLACAKSPAPAPVVAPKAAPAPRPAPPVPPTLEIVYTAGQRGRMTAEKVPPPPNSPPRNMGLSAPTTLGLGRRATIVDRARVESRAVLQVDAGDFLPLPTDDPRDPIAATPKEFPRWRALVLEGLRRLGVDAVTLGPRELGQPGVSARALAAMLDKAHIPVVLANFADAKGAPVFPVDRLVDVGGTSVGVFGVAELPDGAPRPAGGALGDPAAAAKARAAALRARGAKLVVALVSTPGGRARAEAIVAGARADVDVVVTPASSTPSAPNAPAARPFFVDAPDGYARLGRVDVRLKPGAPPAFEDRSFELDTHLPEQLGVGLLAKVATIAMFDSNKLMAEAKRTHHLTNAALYQIYEPWEYGSTKACADCHPKEFAQWQTTDHAHAFATLTKAKHDGDHACLGCHVLGFLQPGGSRDIIMARTQFTDVGCEACHGPSAAHIRSVDKKKGTSQKVSPTVCLGCHTPDWSEGFDPVAAMNEILGPGHGRP